jgi:hypothetical protein
MYLYTLCSIVSALFVRLFPGELGFHRRSSLKTVIRHFVPFSDRNDFMGASDRRSAAPGLIDRLIMFMALSFTLCIVMSVQGGLTAALIEFLGTSGSSGTEGPELLFKLALLRRSLPLVGVEILSRIPLNVIDRLVSVFGAYGIAALLNHVRFFQNRA